MGRSPKHLNPRQGITTNGRSAIGVEHSAQGLLNTSIPARGLRPNTSALRALPGRQTPPKHLNPRQGITTRERDTFPHHPDAVPSKHLNPRQGITTHERAFDGTSALNALLNTSIPARGLRLYDRVGVIAFEECWLLNTSIPARGLRLLARERVNLPHEGQLLNTSIPARGLRPAAPNARAWAMISAVS